MAVSAGSVFVSLFGKFDRRDFTQFDEAVVKASRHKEIKTALGAQFDAKAFKLYEEQLKRSQRLAEQRSKFKAALGADFDPRAFRQYAKASQEAEHQTNRLGAAHARLTEHLKRAAGAAIAAGSAYAGLRAAESAIETTDALARTTLLLHRNFGLATKAASDWAVVTKSRDVDPTALHMGFTALSRAVETASQQLIKQGMATGDVAKKQAQLRAQIDALGHSKADEAKRTTLLTQANELASKSHEKLTLGAGKQANAFKTLGITQAQLIAGRHDFSGLLAEVTKGFENLHGGTERAALAQALFGRGARSLTPLLRQGAFGFTESAKTAEKYGATLGGKTLDQMEALLKKQREAKFATLGLQIAFATALAPAMTKVLTVVNQFVLQMHSGTGAGGQFAKGIQGIADIVRPFVPLLRVAALTLKIVVAEMLLFLEPARRLAGLVVDLTHKLGDLVSRFVSSNHIVAKAEDAFLSLISTVLDGVHALADIGSHLPIVGGRFKDLAKATDQASDKVNKLRDGLHPAEGRLDDVSRAAGRLSAHLGTGLSNAAGQGASAMRKRFGEATGSVTRNFADLQAAADKALGSIAGQVNSQLSQLGSHVQIKTGSRGDSATHARGGWIGRRGQVSGDVVPIAPGILAALGEYDANGPGGQRAIINRYQAPIVEDALARGGWPGLDHLPAGHQLPIIEQAMEVFGGLDALFAMVRRPHYLAEGGRFATGGLAGMTGAAMQLERAHFPYRWGGGHQASPAPFGPMDCSGAVSYVLQHGGVDIPTMTSGSLEAAGQPGPGPVTVFANPTHTFMRLPGLGFFGTSGSNPGGGAGFFPPPGAGYLSRFVQRHFTPGGSGIGSVVAPTVRGAGALAGILRAAVGLSARAANRFLTSQFSGVGGGDVGDPGPGITGRVSTFGPPTEPAGATASGASSSLPGIAIFDRSTLGRVFQVAIGQHKARLTQTDIGPAPWTGRKIDVTGAGASRMGINPRQFPTDAVGTAMPFARGGRSTRKPVPKVSASPTNRLIRSLRALQTDRIGDWDKAMSDVADLQKRYGVVEARYNITDEELIRDDGSLNAAAFTTKTNELADLLGQSEAIRKRLQDARAIGQRVVRTYRSIVAALKASLTHAPKKSRGGVKARIDTYETRLDEWRGKMHDLETGDLPDAGTDVLQLRHEVADLQRVPGSAAAAVQLAAQQARDDAVGQQDTGGAGGAGAGAGGADADLQAQQSQVLAQLQAITAGARLNAASLAAFASPGDIGTGRASTALAAVGGSATSTQVGALSTPQVPAGYSPTVYQTINTLYPADSATYRAIGDASVRGLGLQPSRSPSTTRLPI